MYSVLFPQRLLDFLVSSAKAEHVSLYFDHLHILSLTKDISWILRMQPPCWKSTSTKLQFSALLVSNIYILINNLSSTFILHQLLTSPARCHASISYSFSFNL